jgi:type IV pilus assembly protein PilB
LEREAYLVGCWNCLGEFDAQGAVWCSDDPKCPTKLCPFCFHCFCDASEEYKKTFWRNAPLRLQEELQTLTHSKDRLGDILVRTKRLTIPQLLETLVEQRATGKKLGELLIERGLVKPDDIEQALKTQGVQTLADTKGVAYSARPVWEQSSPEAILQYILSLGVRRGASDVHIEPKEDGLSIKYRIDGFFFRVDPIPKACQAKLMDKIFEWFELDPRLNDKPQTSRMTRNVGEAEYDLVAQTLPTAHGTSATLKLINRATFIKDFATLGLDIEDRVHLMEQLRGPFGLLLVTSPAFNGAGTTAYAIMNFLVHAQRDVVSLEAPVHWRMDGVRQVEVTADERGLRMSEALRSTIAVRPEVVMLSAIPDPATAGLVVQLAPSVLVVAVLHAQSAGQAVASLLSMGVTPHILAHSLMTVTCQRLVRKVCTICRQPLDRPAPQTLALHGIDAAEAETLHFFRGKGCPSCNKIGYRGRRAVFEVLGIGEDVRNGILSNLPADEITSLALRAGMQPIRSRCLELVRQGVTTFDEFMRLRL